MANHWTDFFLSVFAFGPVNFMKSALLSGMNDKPTIKSFVCVKKKKLNYHKTNNLLEDSGAYIAMLKIYGDWSR